MISVRIPFFWNDMHNKYMPGNGRAWNPNGLNLASGLQELIAFLYDEVQLSVSAIDLWLKELTNLPESRAPDGFFGMGNAHWVMVKKDHVLLACEFVEEQRVLLTTKGLINILETYKNTLFGNVRNINLPPTPLDAEYISEGKNAIEKYIVLAGNDDDVSCIGMISGET